MFEKTDQLLFDKDNPNGKINTSTDVIAGMLQNIPVLCDENVVGFIKSVTNITPSKIYGTIIYFYSDEYTDMKNYTVNIDIISPNPLFFDVTSVMDIKVEHDKTWLLSWSVLYYYWRRRIWNI